MSKRLTALLLALFLCVATALPAYAAAETAKPDVTISTVEEFLVFAENCRLDSYSRDLTVSLAADLDLTGVDFDGIPIFGGTFDGSGHTVSGLSIVAEGSVLGFFRYLTAAALVQDLTVRGEVSPQGSRSAVGGIAGSSEGTILRCNFSGTVSGSSDVGGLVGVNSVTGLIENCHAAGVVYGSYYVGGVAGENFGVIRSCTNGAEVNATSRQNSVDISDITMDSLTNSESAASVTDIGGIAGANVGVIRECENRAAVGYRHMGYNIGGIAGSQTGYIVDCKNYGAVSGRKEVGGIVGQMEPATRLDYSEDTLQLLQGQMDTMTVLANRAAGNAQSGASAVGGHFSTLRNQSETARDALDQLIPGVDDLRDPETYDIDRIRAAQNTLSSSVTAMPNTLRSIVSSSESAAATLTRDVLAIVDQMNALGKVIGSAENTLGGSIKDVSDEDTEGEVSCETADCVNHGAVLADLNAGGIVGAMAFENELDHEDDLQVSGDASLNFESELRAVVRSCENMAAVTVRRQNAGGIVGWQYMGLTRDCVNSGALDAAAASYVGGIVGRSSGFVRASAAKCVISGDSYVGGIAGSGTIVSDCRSMVKLGGSEKLGAVLGVAETGYTEAENPISGNLYLNVDRDWGGIDGISYANLAQSLETEAFFALEDLPELFRVVTVRFISETGDEKTVYVEPGGRLDMAEIPAVPEKEGYEGEWEGLNEAKLTDILFDLSFTAVYRGNRTVIQSERAGDGGLPVLLVKGRFTGESVVSLAESGEAPGLEEGETLVESWSLTFTGCDEVTGAHYLLPSEVEGGRLRLFVRGESGKWREVEFTVDGSYIVFALSASDADFAAVLTPPSLWPLLAAAGGVVLLLLIVVVSLVSRRKRRKKAAALPEEAMQ